MTCLPGGGWVAHPDTVSLLSAAGPHGVSAGPAPTAINRMGSSAAAGRC